MQSVREAGKLSNMWAIGDSYLTFSKKSKFLEISWPQANGRLELVRGKELVKRECEQGWDQGKASETLKAQKLRTILTVKGMSGPTIPFHNPESVSLGFTLWGLASVILVPPLNRRRTSKRQTSRRLVLERPVACIQQVVFPLILVFFLILLSPCLVTRESSVSVLAMWFILVFFIILQTYSCIISAILRVFKTQQKLNATNAFPSSVKIIMLFLSLLTY